MLDEINKYYNISELFDFEYSQIKKRTKEKDFYLEYAIKSKGNILELGCGTGIITLELTKSNNKVWGIDHSNKMLKVLKSKIDDTVNNITLLESDMIDFKVNHSFNLIIIPNLSFLSLLNNSQRLHCLLNVKKHLNKNGVLIFDVVDFSKISIQNLIGKSFNLWEDETKNNLGIKISKTIKYNNFDSLNSILYFESVYNVLKLKKNKTYSDYLAMSTLSIKSLEEIIKKCNLKIHNKIIGQKNKFPKNNEIIYILKHNT